MKKFLNLLFQGIASGTFILTIIAIVGIEVFHSQLFAQALMDNYLKYSLAAMVIGAGFTVPSIIYEKEELSMGLRILIHMGIGISIYSVIMITVGWIPANIGILGLICSLSFGIGLAFIIWLAFYLYYKKEARDINKKIKEIKKT